DDADNEPARQWHAAPWLPPASHEVDMQRIALEATAEPYGIDAVWLVKVETGVDGIAWLDLTSSVESARDADESDTGEADEIVDGIFDESQEVLYSAPDAPVSEEV